MKQRQARPAKLEFVRQPFPPPVAVETTVTSKNRLRCSANLMGPLLDPAPIDMRDVQNPLPGLVRSLRSVSRSATGGPRQESRFLMFVIASFLPKTASPA